MAYVYIYIYMYSTATSKTPDPDRELRLFQLLAPSRKAELEGPGQSGSRIALSLRVTRPAVVKRVGDARSNIMLSLAPICAMSLVPRVF